MIGIEELRRRLNEYAITDISNRTGLSYHTVRNFMRGKCDNPSANTFRALVDFCATNGLQRPGDRAQRRTVLESDIDFLMSLGYIPPDGYQAYSDHVTALIVDYSLSEREARLLAIRERS